MKTISTNKNGQMKKILLLVFSVFTLGTYMAGAQNTDSFVPSSKPEFKIYSNFNTTVSNGRSASKFDITRVYLGYSYNFSQSLSARVTLEVGNPGVGNFQFAALLKNGYLQYQKEKLTAKIGMIGTPLFDVQETFWGRRYLLKCFEDQYGFGPSNDLGLSVAYKFNDMVSADAIIQNGEGYTVHQSDSTFKVGVGLTIRPVTGITLRGYYDNLKKNDATQQTMALMAGYSGKKIKLGAEYNSQVDNNLVKGRDFSGFSFSGTYMVNAGVNLFARYDCLNSTNKKVGVHEWNYAKDGQLFLVGVECNPVKGIRISPNYRVWSPRDSSQPTISMFFLNLGVDL
jgi:hypothetical protein